jgi:hypothetical protein
MESLCVRSYFENGNVEIEQYYKSKEHGEYYLHRENGPAYIIYNRDGTKNIENYWLENCFHRIDGPAFNCYNTNTKAYFIFGEAIAEEQFNTPGFVDAFLLEYS